MIRPAVARARSSKATSRNAGAQSRWSRPRECSLPVGPEVRCTHGLYHTRGCEQPRGDRFEPVSNDARSGARWRKPPEALAASSAEDSGWLNLPRPISSPGAHRETASRAKRPSAVSRADRSRRPCRGCRRTGSAVNVLNALKSDNLYLQFPQDIVLGEPRGRARELVLERDPFRQAVQWSRRPMSSVRANDRSPPTAPVR